MSVSSYLEAFLTVYGWDMYYVLYLLFASIGLFLYPLMRIVNDVYVNYVGGSEYAGTNYLRQLIASLVMAILVFWIALVPIVSIDLNSATVKSVCTEKKDIKKFKSTYFNNTETRVPLMPYLAMSIGHGINSVIYKVSPCTLDITEAHKAVMAVDLSEAEDPKLLHNELNRFIGECHSQARSRIKDILDNKYGEKVKKQLEKTLDENIDSMVSETGNDDKMQHESYLLTNYDSKLIRGLFYTDFSPLKLYPETKSIPPLLASAAVEGVPGNGSGSQLQGTETPPTCGDWWNELRYELVTAMGESLAVKVSNNLGVEECRDDRYSSHRDGSGGTYMSTERRKACAQKVTESLYKGNNDMLVSEMFRTIQGGSKGDPVLTGSDNAKLTGVTAAIAATGLAGRIPIVGKFFGGEDNMANQAIAQVTGFYMTIFLLKLMLKFFVPMILMAVYMFWGPFMTIGEFKGMIMIKGMVLIVALTMMPGLWAIMEHLDDALYEAMYGSKSISDVFNIILLDITTGIFQISIVFVLFYMINEAGGGDARGAVQSSQGVGGDASSRMAAPAGKTMGRAAGGTAGTAGSVGKKWGTNTWNKIKPKPKYKIGPY